MTSPVYPGAFKLPETTKVYSIRAMVPAHSTVDSLDNAEVNVPSPQIMSKAEAELDDQRPWTTVVHKKSCEKRNTETLRPEQERAVREAEKCLTMEEKDWIRRRSLSVQKETRSDGSSDSETYPKGQKGKGLDPRNWGGLGLSDSELDPDVQCAAYASWNAAHRLACESESENPGPSMKRDTRGNMRTTDDEHPDSSYMPVRHSTKRDEVRIKKKDKEPATRPSRAAPNPIRDMVDKVVRQDHKRWEHQKTPRAMEPTKQVDPKSYIGLMFKHINKGERRSKRPKEKKRKPRHHYHDTSSNESSDEDEPSSNGSSSSSSDSSSEAPSSSDSSDDDSSSTSSTSFSSSGESSSSSGRLSGGRKCRRRGRSKQ
ncbi:hypothetical protein M404DRAFT_34883 [Pisolithus tinctorius Marx 270]|uniref:Uncharacterized protein n=1 Tax=Pisolithus tinctorius Marx 270 TaxID=870435 RepID=A0A0C3IBZ7_PISTI|nr:hypothetical protein M404DRAFT_34883 [Pisolithus tinctorius Marx 270]